jgi:hypothetical protein
MTHPNSIFHLATPRTDQVMRRAWIFTLLGDLLFYQLYRMGIRIALNGQPVAHHFDHRSGALMNQVSHIQRVFLRVGMHPLDAPALAGW